MNCGIKKDKHSQGWIQNNKFEHAQCTEINLVQPTQVTDLSKLEFIRSYSRFRFLTSTDNDFLSFFLNI